MNKDWVDGLKEIYPPTPDSFTEKVDSALRELPKEGARWKMPVASMAAYALVACTVLVLGFALFVRTPDHPQQTTAGPAAGGTAPSGTSAAPTPQPAPLPQLPLSHPQIASAAGWQAAAAAAGDVTWYYKPSSEQIARVKDGKCDAFLLSLSAGQSLDVHTFMAAAGGGALAFTVHGKDGDSVWIVTSEGRKMSIPDDVSWFDIADSTKPLRFDFSGLSMAPESFQVGGGTGSDAQTAATYYIEGIDISAVRPDGSTYNLTVSILDNLYYKGLVRGALTGNIREGVCLSLPDETAVPTSFRGYLIGVYKGADGSYRLGNEDHKVELQSNRFAFFRPQPSQSVFGFVLRYALFVYRDDPENTLWGLDGDTGKVEKIAANCVSAGWLPDGDCWYATASDAAMLQTHAVGYGSPVVAACLLSESYSDGSLTLVPSFEIENHSGQPLTLPATLPCSLKLTRDGTMIWSKDDGVSLQQTDSLFCEPMSGFGGTVDMAEGQFTVPNGYVLSFELNCGIPMDAAGAYRLTGTLYNGLKVNYQMTLPPSYSLPDYIGIDANINPGGRLAVTVVNRSINGVQIPLTSSSDYSGYSPAVCYRLMQDGKEVSHGIIEMSPKYSMQSGLTVPAGGSITFTDPGETPLLGSLHAGDYNLEAFVMNGTNDDKLPWGLAPGLYFEVKFTVPAN